MTSKPDLQFHNHGSLYTVTAETDDGRAWIAANIGDDAMTWGDGIVLEPRYLEDIVTGAREDGLICHG